jgi:TPP-dependent pyruvate/acetoin dehydrogenase alpha subunit
MSLTERLIAFERRLQADMHNIHNPTHLCLGQEQVPQAMSEHLVDGDWVFSTHRAHGHALAAGVDEQKLWDEIHGLDTGLNGGFAGSQGFSDPSRNFHCSAIVGGLVGVATGTAMALKLSHSPNIVVCCIGDAGTEQGVWWESINFAALHGLPIAYLCENNGKSVDSPILERQAAQITSRVKAFGLKIGSSVESAMRFARTGEAAFYEHKCALACDHLNLSSLLPKLDYA